MGAKLMAPIRVLIADGSPIVRIGMGAMLRETRSFQQFVLEQAETTEEAIFKVETGEYDVVFMEHDLPGRGGPKAIELILARKPGVSLIGISWQFERRIVEQMVAAGAKGYVLKSIDTDTLVAAIRSVLSGKLFFSNDIAVQWVGPALIQSPLGPLERLTKREKEVFHMILKGLNDREIGTKLFLSKRTVDKHRSNLMHKLGVRNSVELTQKAFALGVLR